MIRIFYPQKDASIYERLPSRNTGIDQILELNKNVSGESGPDQSDQSYTWEDTYNSRILIKFDTATVQQQISSGLITGQKKFYLSLKAAEAAALPVEYTIHAHALSQSWVNGNGHYWDSPQQTNGVSWTYRNSKNSNVQWKSSSYATNSTGSWSSQGGGGTWYTTYTTSQSFSHNSPDVRMDVTSIVNAWLSGSVVNDGFILKFSNADEKSTDVLGSIKFFSKETHTIYIPKLEVEYSNESFSGTGSFTQINTDNYVVYFKNIRDSYKENQLVKLRLGVRPRYPQKTYSTSSAYLDSWRLPSSSYYSIVDVPSGETVFANSTLGTKVGCDTTGNYIQLDMNSFLPERYYRIMLHINDQQDVSIIDDGFYFKVQR